MLSTSCLEKNVVKMTNLSPSAHQMPSHPLNFGNCFGLQMYSPQITPTHFPALPLTQNIFGLQIWLSQVTSLP